VAPRAQGSDVARRIVFGVACAAECFLFFNAIFIAHRLMEIDPLAGTPMKHSMGIRILVSPYWQWGTPIIGGAWIAWLAIKQPTGLGVHAAAAITLLASAFVTLAFG
jgi:hypothetical protein